MEDVMPEAQPPARQPCSARIVGQWLHVLDGEAALRVFDLGAFGKGLLSRSRPEGLNAQKKQMKRRNAKRKILPYCPTLQLSLEEGFYLAYDTEQITIVAEDDGPRISSAEAFARFTAMQPDFKYYYTVYRHFRRAGWVPRSGIKYGVDYLLYPSANGLIAPGALHCHAPFSVIVRRPPTCSPDRPVTPDCLTWHGVQSMSRLACQVAKHFMVAFVEEGAPLASIVGSIAAGSEPPTHGADDWREELGRLSVKEGETGCFEEPSTSPSKLPPVTCVDSPAQGAGAHALGTHATPCDTCVCVRARLCVTISRGRSGALSMGAGARPRQRGACPRHRRPCRRQKRSIACSSSMPADPSSLLSALQPAPLPTLPAPSPPPTAAVSAQQPAPPGCRPLCLPPPDPHGWLSGVRLWLCAATRARPAGQFDGSGEGGAADTRAQL